MRGWETHEAAKESKPLSNRQRAENILHALDNNPDLMREFNLLLRDKKIKQIKDGR